jgi:hypothetical protein
MKEKLEAKSPFFVPASLSTSILAVSYTRSRQKKKEEGRRERQ